MAGNKDTLLAAQAAKIERLENRLRDYLGDEMIFPLAWRIADAFVLRPNGTIGFNGTPKLVENFRKMLILLDEDRTKGQSDDLTPEGLAMESVRRVARQMIEDAI